MSGYSLELAGSITGIDKAAWNSCAGASCPFLSWEFLALLEACGAVGEGQNWIPAHARLVSGNETIAYLPLFIALSSNGSFVWDDGMEEVAASVGKRWYPKLLGAVPFTPAPLWKPLVVAGFDEAPVAAAATEAIVELARKGGFSGVHLQWTDPVLGTALAGADRAGTEHAGTGHAGGQAASAGAWIEWKRQVYRWDNAGYGTFDDFTDSFSKNMRRNVARDRADVARSGISVRIVRGDEAGDPVWNLMADLYERTNDKFGPWAARFLPRAFFEMAPSFIGHLVRFSAAWQESAAEPMALAMLFQGTDTLWGRYWGTRQDLPGLHFETCYYAPIDYAIREGLSGFDPGMGSEHKARRGFRSYLSSSFHRVFDPRLHRVFANALREASAAEVRNVALLNEELPFKSTP